jgi:hypothetical protein
VDEKLKRRLQAIINSIYEDGTKQFPCQSVTVHDIEQAFLDAGWHSKGECLKGLDLEKMPKPEVEVIVGGHAIEVINKIDVTKLFAQLMAYRQACIDWLKEQLQGRR